MYVNEKPISEPETEESHNIGIFKEEAYDRLAELENVLLELETNPDDSDLIDSAFRAMHTIKGSGGMFGFDEIVDFTHHIESVYDKVRDGKVKITSELIALTLAAHDEIKKMLDRPSKENPEDTIKRAELTKSFVCVLSEEEKDISQKENTINAPVKNETAYFSYRIRFRPPLELFSTGTNPILLLRDLGNLGQVEIEAQNDKIPFLEEIDPEGCYTWWDIVLTTNRGINEIEDIFIFVNEICDIKIEIIDSDNNLENQSDYKRLGEILVDRGDIDPKELKKVLNEQQPLGEKLTNAGLLDPGQVKSALAEQKIIKTLRENRIKANSVSSIRVSSDKLDKLVDLVGELVTGQARLSQIANSRDDSSLLSISEEIERLTTELRDNTMSVRMLTFGTTFSKFKRLVRDLSANLNIDIELITEGGETELDKNVIEQLNDPLVHIIRNAADHGIESPDIREQSGKPLKGTIHLSASYSGAHVLIKIKDDGAGLNSKVIRQKAIAKGLINPNAKLTDRETYFLIFEPGFSTAKEVTNLSGRGVGMDVVKKAIENLRGSVDIESELGKGTTITLKLPLTLAIIDGLLVMVGNANYVIPLASVEECIELTDSDIAKTHGRHVTNVREQIVPYIRLRDQFNIGGKRPDVEQIVITEIENHRVGFVVDSVVGQHQTVIKKLNSIYKNVETFSGATIMADGTVALIIDINKHFQFIEKQCTEYYNG